MGTFHKLFPFWSHKVLVLWADFLSKLVPLFSSRIKVWTFITFPATSASSSFSSSKKGTTKKGRSNNRAKGKGGQPKQNHHHNQSQFGYKQYCLTFLLRRSSSESSRLCQAQKSICSKSKCIKLTRYSKIGKKTSKIQPDNPLWIEHCSYKQTSSSGREFESLLGKLYPPLRGSLCTLSIINHVSMGRVYPPSPLMKTKSTFHRQGGR